MQNQEVTKPSTDHEEEVFSLKNYIDAMSNDKDAGPSTVRTSKTGNEKTTLKKYLDSMSKEEQVR